MDYLSPAIDLFCRLESNQNVRGFDDIINDVVAKSFGKSVWLDNNGADAYKKQYENYDSAVKSDCRRS